MSLTSHVRLVLGFLCLTTAAVVMSFLARYAHVNSFVLKRSGAGEYIDAAGGTGQELVDEAVPTLRALLANETFPPAVESVTPSTTVTSTKHQVLTTSGSSLNVGSSVFRERTDQLTERCSRLMPSAGAPRPMFTMYADTRFRYFYCMIPKVACTGWLQTLAKAAGKRNPTHEFVHGGDGKISRYVPYFGSFTPKTRARILKSNFKFMFARHPFERLVSAYRNKFQNLQTDDISYRRYSTMAKRLKRKYRGTKRGGPLRFSEFAAYLLDPKTPRPFDRHRRPYHELCQPCSVRYDFVGRYETLDEDVDSVLRRLKLYGRVQFAEFRRKSNSSSRHVVDMFATLSPGVVRRLQRLYYYDFELFGYKWPIED